MRVWDKLSQGSEIFLRKAPRTLLFISLFVLALSCTRSTLACAEPTAVYPDLSSAFISANAGLPADYIPTGLTELGGKAEANGSACLKTEAADSLIKMFEAARTDGIKLAITAAYKKPAEQQFSENQLGTAVDLTDASIGYAFLNSDFSSSQGGRWMRRNAHKYGFVMSHPQRDKYQTGFDYEPWHWRYVGQDWAKKIVSWRADLSDLQAETEWPTLVPVNELTSVSLNADAFISVYADGSRRYTLISKNENKPVPIASISKLVTALAIKKYYKEDAQIVIRSDNPSGEGTAYRYRAGDAFKASDLLYSVLVESDNDAAAAFAEAVSEEAFVNMMNSIASQLSLNSTVFYNPTGLDLWQDGPKNNLSTPSDIVALMNHIAGQYPDIMAITRIREYLLQDLHGQPHHLVGNTNALLYDTDLPVEILGGKTGTTPAAGTNLVLVIRPPHGEGTITNVVLGSDDSFGDMRNLINWLLENYLWTQVSASNADPDIIS